MGQRVLLDRHGLATYLVALVLGGCRMAPAPVVPEAAAPVSDAAVARWVAATAPAGHRIYRFRWLFQDERSSAGGRGSVRIAAPDSLRLDIAGPFGARAASAVVVGDSGAWARPEDMVRDLVPSYPLLWAMLGVARPPDPAAELRGLRRPQLTAWQYIDGIDTVAYATIAGEPRRIQAEVRRAGEVIGRVETTLDSAGRPVESRLTVPSVPARLDLDFDAIDSTVQFPPTLWIPDEP